MLTNIIFERSRHAPKKLFKVNVRQTAKSRAETKGAVKHGRFDSHVSIIFPFCFVFIFWSTGLHRLVMLMFSMSFNRKKSEVWSCNIYSMEGYQAFGQLSSILFSTIFLSHFIHLALLSSFWLGSDSLLLLSCALCLILSKWKMFGQQRRWLTSLQVVTKAKFYFGHQLFNSCRGSLSLFL